MAENEIKHKIVISGEQEYKRAMSDMNAQLREAKSNVKATAAEMDAQGKSEAALAAQLEALQKQSSQENEILAAMREHLQRVSAASGESSREAVTLRTRINAMRQEVAQTNSQIGALTDELNGAAQAEDKLGTGGAQDGLRALAEGAGEAQEQAGGLASILENLGQGVQIGIGLGVGKAALDAVTGAIKTAVQTGFNEAVDDQKLFNRIGIVTGTSGTQQNSYLMQIAERLMVRNPALTSDQAAGNVASGYTLLPKKVVDDADLLVKTLQQAQTLSEGIGGSVDSVLYSANQIQTVWSTDIEDALGIIYGVGTSKAAADGLSVLDQYAMSFEKIGLSAGESASAVVTASENGIDKLGNFGKAVANAGAYLDEAEKHKGQMNDMGLIAADMGAKFDRGGTDAANAMKLMLEKLLGLKDEKLQDEIGSTVFGSENWKKYGTLLATTILDSYGEDMTSGMKDRLRDAMDAATNDLASQFGISKSILTEVLGSMVQPEVDSATQVIRAGNEAMIAALEEGKDGIEIAGAGLNAALAEVGNTEIGETVRERMRVMFSPDLWLQDLGIDAIAASQETMSQLVQQVTEPLLTQVAEIDRQMIDALSSGDQELAEELQARKDELLRQVEEANLTAVSGELQAGAEDAGESTVTGLQTGLSGIYGPVQQAGETATGALGDGLSGMSGAADMSVSAMLEILRGAENDAYSAGWNAGKAFERGYKAAQVIRSPSHVMTQLAEESLAGLLSPLKEGERELEARGNALGVSLASGYVEGLEPSIPAIGRDNLAPQGRVAGYAGSQAWRSAPGGEGGTADGAKEIAQAVRDGMQSMAFLLDGEAVGYGAEEAVSRASYARTAGTIRGRAGIRRGL